MQVAGLGHVIVTVPIHPPAGATVKARMTPTMTLLLKRDMT
jgi:hypothetical protein